MPEVPGGGQCGEFKYPDRVAAGEHRDPVPTFSREVRASACATAMNASASGP